MWLSVNLTVYYNSGWKETLRLRKNLHYLKSSLQQAKKFLNMWICTRASTCRVNKRSLKDEQRKDTRAENIICEKKVLSGGIEKWLHFRKSFKIMMYHTLNGKTLNLAQLIPPMTYSLRVNACYFPLMGIYYLCISTWWLPAATGIILVAL